MDIASPVSFTTPGGTIIFNDGTADQYYLNSVPGLDGTTARRAMDRRAFGDGLLEFPEAWLDGRFFQPTGSLLITSTQNQQAIREIRNEMEADLLAAYESTLNADGTWEWEPEGEASRVLVVRRDLQACEFVHVDNFLVVDFSFGLVAADPIWQQGS